ncbi:Os01g0706266 [Oryza sativa Japonica Group]|uniref:Os01g0706266 protein n=1 Tax=Oryza sativa subsp. japonica TaxID=39947 RepID=A0A0P0V768_ORYSJ|nr:Os01g0706266 [Oryza sativa Japonica Group]
MGRLAIRPNRSRLTWLRENKNTHPISVTNAVSRVLAAHPGPFHRVDLSCSIMEAHLPELDRWLQLLAAKAVEELVFVNRPWPINLRLPATLFSCTYLRRLYIGVWRFPNTAGLPQCSTAFPHLLELGLCCVLMEDRDLESIISRSPVLEILTVVLSQNVVRLRFVSHSLRCVQLGFSCVADLAAVDAPCLDRLLLSDIWATEGRKFSTRIKIGLAQGLRSLGYLEPGRHLLQIGTTTIKARTRATPSTMVPSVRILALKVYFGTLNEAQMLCSFLQCFPNVETLHLKLTNSTMPLGSTRPCSGRELVKLNVSSHMLKRWFSMSSKGSRVSLPSSSLSWRGRRCCKRLILFPPMQVAQLWRRISWF